MDAGPLFYHNMNKISTLLAPIVLLLTACEENITPDEEQKQTPITPIVQLALDRYECPASGGPIGVVVQSTTDYEVVMPENMDWITNITTKAIQVKQFTFSVARSLEQNERSAKIIFNDRVNNVADTLLIIQQVSSAVPDDPNTALGLIVHVEKAGTFREQLTDEQYTLVHKLVISGNLNNTDLEAINDMWNLVVLDMREATIENNAIPSDLFTHYEELACIGLPQTLQKIDKEAFRELYKIRTMTIPASVTYIGENAISSNIEEIVSLSVVPPVVENNLGIRTSNFHGNPPVLHVPAQSISEYKVATGWKDFQTIIAIEE